MKINSLDELYFSQLSLTVYDNCPLKFRRRYLDGLYWPADWSENFSQKEIVEKGKEFHLLAQRYYDRGEIIEKDYISEELLKWFNKLKKFRPYNNTDKFSPEHELRINTEKIKLVAKYDLLYIDKNNNELIIYDWKTNKKRFIQNKLKDNLQTKVYLYVLAEAGSFYYLKDNFDLNKMSIIYWNPRYPKQTIKISYNKEKFRKDKKFLKNKIKEIKNLDYNDFEKTDNKKACKFCEYRPICSGKKPETIEVGDDDIDLEIDWDNIDEMSF
ncbi:MAG: PD-(D/E)XK nuclease family protein [Bacillota bacterium]